MTFDEAVLSLSSKSVIVVDTDAAVVVWTMTIAFKGRNFLILYSLAEGQSSRKIHLDCAGYRINY